MDDHKKLMMIAFGLLGLWRVFTDRKKYRWKKTFQFLAVAAVVALGFCLGIDIVWLTEDSPLKAAIVQLTDGSGFWADSNGFLIQVGSGWYGIYREHVGLVQIPALAWPTIIAFIASILIWLLDWRRSPAVITQPMSHSTETER